MHAVNGTGVHARVCKADVASAHTALEAAASDGAVGDHDAVSALTPIRGVSYT